MPHLTREAMQAAMKTTGGSIYMAPRHDDKGQLVEPPRHIITEEQIPTSVGLAILNDDPAALARAKAEALKKRVDVDAELEAIARKEDARAKAEKPPVVAAESDDAEPIELGSDPVPVELKPANGPKLPKGK